jgi:hypothetical protein
MGFPFTFSAGFKQYTYEISCVQADPDDIDEMVDGAKPVSYKEFVANCAEIEEMATGLGYEAHGSRKGLTLNRDAAVSFFKSTYQGKPCYFMVHSQIDYIWVLEGATSVEQDVEQDDEVEHGFHAAFLRTARPTQQKIDLLTKQMGLTPEQIELCIQTDPSPNQSEFVTCLARWLSKKLIHLPEDSEHLNSQFKTFLKLKRSPAFTGNKDINTYTPAQLNQTISENELTAFLRPKEQANVQDGAEVFYRKGDLLIYKVTKAKALAALSDGTSWCTRHEDTGQRYLDGGPSYVVFFNGSAFGQLHSATNQYRDRSDGSFLKEFSSGTGKRKGRGWGRSVRYDTELLGKAIENPVALEALDIIASKDPQVAKWRKDNITPAAELMVKLKADPKHSLAVAIMENQPFLPEQEKLMGGGFSAAELNNYAHKFHLGQRWQPYEEALLKERANSLWVDYAENFIKGRWKECEQGILRYIAVSAQYANLAMQYATKVVKGRWKEFEDKIYNAKTPNKILGELAVTYALNVLKSRWPNEQPSLEGVGVLSKPEYIMVRYAPTYAVDYAEAFIPGGWPEFEQMAINPPPNKKAPKLDRWGQPTRQRQREDDDVRNSRFLALVNYADKILKKRSPEIEEALLTKQNDHDLIRKYARNVIKGRWPEYEQTLLKYAASTSRNNNGESTWKYVPEHKKDNDYYGYRGESNYIPTFVYAYLKEFVKGRWPELEKIIMENYTRYPDEWQKNQRWLNGYLLFLQKLGIDWPEGWARLHLRSPEYEQELVADAYDEDEKGYKWWGGAGLGAYLKFLEKTGQDWPEGRKIYAGIQDASDRKFNRGEHKKDVQPAATS